MNEDKVKEVFSNNIWTNYGYDYCSYLVARHIHPLLDIPDNGYIVQIGSGLGLALERLCVIYGYERVIGYDWANPLNHPNVKIIDCNKLDDSYDIAFCEIDVAAAHTHPELRLQCLRWTMGNIVKGGKILFNNNFAAKHFKIDIEKYVEDNGFSIKQLKSFSHPELEVNYMKSRINTKMICTKL